MSCIRILNKYIKSGYFIKKKLHQNQFSDMMIYYYIFFTFKEMSINSIVSPWYFLKYIFDYLFFKAFIFMSMRLRICCYAI